MKIKFINHRLIEVREPVITLSTNDRTWKNEARWAANGFWNDVFLMPSISMFETPDAAMREHGEA